MKGSGEGKNSLVFASENFSFDLYWSGMVLVVCSLAVFLCCLLPSGGETPSSPPPEFHPSNPPFSKPSKKARTRTLWYLPSSSTKDHRTGSVTPLKTRLNDVLKLGDDWNVFAGYFYSFILYFR